MTRARIAGLICLVPLALVAASCGSATPVEPTPPVTTVDVTETYTGSLVQLGSNSYNFHSEAGIVTATLTDVQPLTTLSLGVDLGQWLNDACSAVVTNTNTKVGTQLVGTAASPVQLCVRVYDVGNIAADTTVTYSLSVVHPDLPQ
jgi:hypothetical protein